MYWVPLIEINNSWTGIACPLPLQKNWINFIQLNNSCKFNGKNYLLATNKIFSTPHISTSATTSVTPIINKVDSSFINYFTNFNGIRITLSGRLKGISKAKKLVLTHGIIKPHSINNRLDYYARPIYTKWGTIGLKVIC